MILYWGFGGKNKVKSILTVALVGLEILCAGRTVADATPQVPIANFAKTPDFVDIKISPTGKYIAMRFPLKDNFGLAVFSVSPLKITAKIVLGEHQGIAGYQWVSPQRLVLSPAAQYGTYDLPILTGELIGINADGSNQVYLYGQQGGGRQIGTLIHRVEKATGFASIIDPLPSDPDHAIIAVNSFYEDSDTAVTETYRLNVNNGFLDHRDAAPVYGYASFLTDHNGKPRFAVVADAHQRVKTFFRPASGGDWQALNTAGLEDAKIFPHSFSGDDNVVYLTSDEEGGYACLFSQDLSSGQRIKLSCNKEGGDIGGIVDSFDGLEPIGTLQMSSSGKPTIQMLDTKNPDGRKLAQLAEAFPGNFVVPVSRTSDGSKVVLFVYSDKDPGGYYMFDTHSMRADPLFPRMEGIEPEDMSPVTRVSYKARDGQLIVAYLTVPKGKEAKNLPMVTLPHGGPFYIRDDWGWYADAQFLASRGYVVLQPNFRGSSGYGSAFVEAGRNGWDGVMIDDITDGTRWAVAQGIADPKRLCIYGASYGGYAALMSAVREPDLYKCAIGYAGVYDLPKWKRDSDVGYTVNGRTYISEFIGASPDRLRAASPIAHLDRLKAAVMIVHGKEDRRVPFNQAEALRSALDAMHYPYEWMAVSEEGHGFYMPENREKLFAKMQDFLDRNIGNSAEVLVGEATH